MELKEFRKKYQGRYYKCRETRGLGYYYLKKVLSPFKMFNGDDGFLCITDYFYKPDEETPRFWEDQKIAISEREKGNTNKICRSEYCRMLIKFGYDPKGM